MAISNLFRVFLFSLFDFYSLQNWIAEISAPLTLIGILSILYFSKKFQFSNFAYIMMIFWAILHTIGAKYSFAAVPFDFLEWENRNQFDRIAHFTVGFLAIGFTELVFLSKKIPSKFIALIFGFFAVMTLAATYEIFEWGYAEFFGGEMGLAFLGSQGDIWDAQKDMLMDGFGGCFGLFLWYILNSFQKKKDGQKKSKIIK